MMGNQLNRVYKVLKALPLPEKLEINGQFYLINSPVCCQKPSDNRKKVC
jgi:hypothetical protein